MWSFKVHGHLIPISIGTSRDHFQNIMHCLKFKTVCENYSILTITLRLSWYSPFLIVFYLEVDVGIYSPSQKLFFCPTQNRPLLELNTYQNITTPLTSRMLRISHTLILDNRQESVLTHSADFHPYQKAFDRRRTRLGSSPSLSITGLGVVVVVVVVGAATHNSILFSMIWQLFTRRVFFSVETAPTWQSVVHPLRRGLGRIWRLSRREAIGDHRRSKVRSNEAAVS